MEEKKIAFYHCHTPLHIGSGTTLDIIDLPIQREAHTDFPVMPSTAIKGVIKAEYWNKILNNDIDLKGIKDDFINPPENPEGFKAYLSKKCKFKETDKEIRDKFNRCWQEFDENNENNFVECIKEFLEDFEDCKEKIEEVLKLKAKTENKKFFEIFGYGDREGDIIFTDGKILLFPVKSVKGVFAWITCPLVLERFVRDTEIKIDNLEKIKNLDDKEATAGENIRIDNYLVLEEISFTVKNEEKNILETIHNLLPENLKKEITKEKIAVVSNERFRYFVKNHTEVNTRTRIDQITGTVKEGALWYEELVPAETVFYNLILSRTNNKDNNNLNLISNFIDGEIFQFGGDETLGRGFTKVYVKEEKNV